MLEEGAGEGGEGGPPHHLAAELLSLRDPLLLGAPVLEPDLDLGVGQLQLGRELRALGDGEVGLGLVLPLEAVQLLGSEGGPRLAVSAVLAEDGSGPGGCQGLVQVLPLQRSQEKEL